ncbi:uncharacterized protein HGUI_00384 [Hanseniaspora guilliermondii]|uniref:Trafficking protein particle complex subunit n=1 Tax=Hanseniaspora guilliermondii TaxID=56406 RepID=A0A1L0AVN3_9ASCO|nr:uncharacterized protein HGUI_00384 [Hanseniaspora guilliermondii]
MNNNLFGYEQDQGPKITQLTELNKDSSILNSFNDKNNVNNQSGTLDLESIKNNVDNGTKLSVNAAKKNYEEGHDVSMSAYLFVLLEFIKTIVSDIDNTNHSKILGDIGHDVGIRIYELVNFKLLNPKKSMSTKSALIEKMDNYKYIDNLSHGSTLNISQVPSSEEIYSYISTTTVELEESGVIKNLKHLSFITLLQFIQDTIWKYMFGKKADDIQKINEDDSSYAIIDNDPLIASLVLPAKVNEFICGIIKGVVESANYKCESVNTQILEDKTYNNKSAYIIKLQK